MNFGCFPVYDWLRYEYKYASSIKAWYEEGFIKIKGVNSIVSRFSRKHLPQMSELASTRRTTMIFNTSSLSWSPRYMKIFQQIRPKRLSKNAQYLYNGPYRLLKVTLISLAKILALPKDSQFVFNLISNSYFLDSEQNIDSPRRDKILVSLVAERPCLLRSEMWNGQPGKVPSLLREIPDATQFRWLQPYHVRKDITLEKFLELKNIFLARKEGV